MQTALRVSARVLPGRRLEIAAPELIEGEDVEVFVVMPETPKPAKSLPESPAEALFGN